MQSLFVASPIGVKNTNNAMVNKQVPTNACKVNLSNGGLSKMQMSFGQPSSNIAQPNSQFSSHK
jgi:hypothetical protein